MSLGTDPKLCNFCHPDYLAVVPDLKLMDDELQGTRQMHAESRNYIRKWGAEKKANFDIRRVCETFFEGYGRTLSAAIGMLFAKPPSIEWNKSESAMEEHWANIDAVGTAGPVFVKRFAESAIAGGLAALVVDHPRPPEGVTITAANEQELNLRPTWAMYHRAQIINWRFAVVNNQRIPTLMVFHEPTDIADGPFGSAQVDRFRVLRKVEPVTVGGVTVEGVATWTLYEQVKPEGKSPDDFRIHSAGMFLNRDGLAATKLPVGIAYAGRTDAPMTAKPPLLGVAWANLAHWQLSTSLRFNSEVAGFAQPCVVGDLATNPDTGKTMQLEVGPLVSVQVATGGDFKWVEAQGTGLERLALLVLEKLRQIAALGVSFLASDTRAAETAEAKRLDASAESSTLATAGQGIEDAVNVALEWHGWYLGIEKVDAPVLTLSRDFEDTSMQADMLTAYVRAIADAGMPPRILLEAMQRGGLIGTDEDIAEIEAEMTANQAATEDALQERSTALAASGGSPAGRGMKVIRDEQGRVSGLAPDAEGQPTRGGDAGVTTELSLNGAQITAAVEVLKAVASGEIAEVPAVELLVAVGIERPRAVQMVKQQAENAITPAEAAAEVADQTPAPVVAEPLT